VSEGFPATRPQTGSRPQRGVFLDEETELAEKEELWTDDAGEDYAGWFCVATDPFPCPAAGCTFVANYMTAVHLILVWQERDDPNLLRHAQRAQEVGRNPRVVVYQSEFGPSASYYAWEASGRPVHGIRAERG
jgi:hypothetical protein